MHQLPLSLSHRYVQKKTELLLSFLNKFKEKKFFALAYYDVLTHDNQNGMSLMKKYIFDILEQLKKNQLIHKTMILLFSDHGTRVSSYVFSDHGFYEARLPFMYIILPKWFRKRHKEQSENLVQNSHMLSSNFDIYRTLLEIPQNVFQRRLKFKASASRTLGQSLFTAISSQRTCTLAGIPEQWCACVKLIRLPRNSTEGKTAGKRLIEEINQELHKKMPDKCLKYELKAVLEAQSHGIQGIAKLDSMKTVSSKQTILVTVEVLPSFARFRGWINLHQTNSRNNVEIERLDSYGNQSHCVPDHPQLSSLRHKCLCLD